MLKNRILIVDDDPTIHPRIREKLSDMFHLFSASTLLEARRKFYEKRPDIVLLDLTLPDGRGEDFLTEIKKSDPCIPVIIISSDTSMDSIVKTIKSGAYDYVTKEFDMKRLSRVTENAAYLKNFTSNKVQLNYMKLIRGKELFYGATKRMQEIRLQIEALRSCPINVLVSGESGTGKELVARDIHFSSDAKDRPFLAVNMAAIPETLAESHMFGHERGSFTGAIAQQKGKFELAEGGTLFFDEITEIPLSIQAKLLRVLQDGEFERVGGIRPIHSDVRIVSATNQNIEELVKRGEIRKDLYYRLKVVTIELPPLRERREDLKDLAYLFLGRYARKYKKEVSSISKEVLEAFHSYSWPGNIRELENIINEMVAISGTDELGMEVLHSGISVPGRKETFFDLHEALRDFERKHISMAIEKANFSKKKAAELLNIPYTTLKSKFDRLYADASDR